MNLAIILFLGGAVVIAWIYLWSRQQKTNDPGLIVDDFTFDVPMASNGDAVLVSQEHGKLIYANGPARTLLGANGGIPHLEQVARMADPADNFLQLFTREGQSSFQLGHKWVEATSHRIPAGPEVRTVIVLRELQANTTSPETLDMNLAMSLINEMGETINASMGLQQVLPTILSVLKRGINYDAGEICLWDEEAKVLHQRGWVGDSTYLIALAESGGTYAVGEGITGWIARFQKPVLIHDASDPANIQPKIADSSRYVSFLGVPLKLGDRFIGTLEFASERPSAFTSGDLALLQAVNKSVAGMIYNTEIYGKQVARLDDLASLQDILSEQEHTPEAAPVYAALNQRIARLLSADMCGIFLYDTDRQGLVAMPPFHGLPEALIRGLFIPMPEDSPQRDIWEHQSYWVSNDVTDEPLAEALGLMPLISVSGITNSAWFPLQISTQRIGVIAVSNKRTEGGFTARDLQHLSVLASQATIVIENLRLYQREQRMDTELIGLQELTNAIGALSHETEFYGEITERIARLMQMEMCGILLYDTDRKRLVSQRPFYGVEDEIVREYGIELTPGSVMEQLWEDEPYWFSNRVLADSLVFEAGLDELAEKAGVQKTLIAALVAGGRKLGVVQISNKLNGADFDDGDARLLMVFATQTAAIIQNARLYREAQRSAEQAQGLRRVAELAGNVLTTQETFTPMLAEISSLTNSELVFVNVLDQQTGTLVTFPRWVYGMELSEPIVQDIYSEGFEHSPVMSLVPYIGNDISNDKRVLPSYRQVAARLKLKNAILVPLVFGERTLGELGIANRPDGPYAKQDLEVLQAIAAQAAAALDRLLLYEATGQNLNRRLEELDAISRVSNELTITLNLEHVLEVICDQAQKATNATGATVVMLKPFEEWALPNMPEIESRLGPGSAESPADIEVEAALRGAENVLVKDYDASPHMPMPGDARSAVAAAITYLDRVVGVLHLYHTQPNHFDDQAAAFLMTLAVKASLGFGNASRYQEQIERSERLRRRVDQLNRIFEFGQMFQSSTDPEVILETIAYGVQQSVGFDTVLMMLRDDETGEFYRAAQAGLPIAAFEQSRSKTISQDKLEKLFREPFRVSESYFFPINRVAEWFVEDMNALSTAFDGKRSINVRGKQWWHDGDMLLVPLKGATGQALGVMSLDRPFDNLRPDQSTIEVLEIFANQAATVIENALLYQESLRNAEQEARLNELAEAVASTLDVQEIVRSVAEGIRRILPFNRMTAAIADAEGQGYNVLHILPIGDDLDIASERRATLGQSALQLTIDDRHDHVFRQGDKSIQQLDDLSSWYKDGEQASLLLPLLTGGETLGAIHIGFNFEDSLAQLEEFRLLLRRMAQMVATAVQNARLFDQAVSLQILNRSVVESIQQGIVVLDKSGRIISVNEFMNERFGWDSDVAGEDLFKYRPQMADFLAEDLRIVLEVGEPRERINETLSNVHGETSISNFYLYPLRYGPVIRGAVILVEDVTDRARLEQAMQARADQLAALTDMSTRVTASLEREDVIRLTLDEMGELVPYEGMSIWRRNGSFMVLEGHAGNVEAPSEPEFRFLFSQNELTKAVVDNRRTAAIGAPGEFTETLPLHHNVVSWMGVPMVNQGYVVGMIMLSTGRPSAYDSVSDQNVAQAFATQVAIAQANAELFEQTFDRTNELETLLEAAQATSLTTDLDSVFQTVAELMFGALPIDNCAIMIWDEVDHKIELQVDINRERDESRMLPTGTEYDLGEYPAKLKALRNRDVIVITTADKDSPFANEFTELEQYGKAARLLVPLVVRERSIGLIQLDQLGEEVVTQQQVRIARGLGTQVAVAIENARLSAETAAHFEESMVINDLSHAISSTLDLDDMVKIVGSQVPKVTNARGMYIALYNADTGMVTFPMAVEDKEIYEIPPRPLGNDEVSFIIKHRRPLSIGADYFSPDELRKSLGIVNGEGDARSYMGVPLMAGDQVYGVLAVRDTVRTRAFTVNEQRILNIIGPQLAAAIQNARLFDQVSSFADDLNRQVAERTRELENERDRIDTLYQITSELARTLDMDRLMPRALGMVAKAVNAQDGVIMQLDPISDQLYCRSSLNPDALQKNPNGDHDTHPAEHVARWLIEEDEHVEIVNDLHEMAYWDPDAPGAAGWRSALAVLLETNEELLGVMVLLSHEPNAFDESHLRLLVAAANQVASSINNAELYKLIRDQAERLGSLLRQEQEEAEKNKAILEGIADGVVLADSDDKIVLFNTAAERILQIPREQAMGQSLRQITGIYGGSAATWSELMEQQLHEMDTAGADYIDERIEMNGRNVSVHLSPVYTGEKFLGTVSVFRDVTREVEADRSKSEFISNVSHEFRTPLTPIKGYIDMVLMGATGQITDGQKQVLDTVKRNVDRLAVLVDDVLRISELDRGARELNIDEFDLDALIERTLNSLLSKHRHATKDLEIVHERADQPVIIRADQEKITQVLNNVIDNAMSYTLNGGRVDIEVQPDAENQRMIVLVSDTGVGIPEEFYDAIWTRFARHDDTALSMDVAGTGLGLPIVKELVELHNGEVWFESQVGVGTTFYIALPTRQPEVMPTVSTPVSDDRSN